METRLFVGNLPFSVAEDRQLTDIFSDYGEVIQARIILDRETGRSRGFGFVTMASKDEAEKAIQALNGNSYEGRPLTVNIARPREDRPGSGFSR